jgi:ATP-dependent DNA helicase RecG
MNFTRVARRPSLKARADSAGLAQAGPAPFAGLRGFGPSAIASLAEMGLRTAEDLAWWLPFRYEDRRNPVPIAALAPGQWACVRAKISSLKARRTYRKRLSLTEAVASDATGNVHVVWFNQPWLEKSIPNGTEVFLYGKVGLFSVKRGLRLQIDNPEVEKTPSAGEAAVHSGRVVPVYRKAGKLQSKRLRALVHELLFSGASMPEVLPSRLLLTEGWPERHEAFSAAHFPRDDARMIDLACARTPAQRRLIFEELLGFQWSLAVLRKEREGTDGAVIEPRTETGELLRGLLPFHLTGAQRRVLREIAEDLKSTAPMYRLLHGEVGSGKTILAFLADRKSVV